MSSNGNSGDTKRTRQVLRPGFHTIKDFLSVNPTISTATTTTTAITTTFQQVKTGRNKKVKVTEIENDIKKKDTDMVGVVGVGEKEIGTDRELKDLVSADVPMFKMT